MHTLTQIASIYIEEAKMGSTPDVEFCKQSAKTQLLEATCTEDTAVKQFRMAMGAKEETVNELFWWSNSEVYISEIFTGMDINFSEDEVNINFIETKVPGYFFLFWETLVNVCKHYGIKTVTLCNRGPSGFWKHIGFTGSDAYMTYKV